MKSLLKQFSEYVGGRESRKSYWLTVISISFFSVFFLSFIKSGHLSDDIILFIKIYSYLVLPFVFVVLAARRLHDTNNNGWLSLLMLIPCLGPLSLLFYLVQAGDVGENQYGPDPYETEKK